MTTQTISSDTKMGPRELTLIVAATTKMGIGKAGTLPWTGLKKEMAYFARITKRANPGISNSVIMGRKTWESIPPRFQPLKDRVNIVVTHNPASLDKYQGKCTAVDSLEASIEALKGTDTAARAFVIGGAQIYKASLEMKEAKRILLTRVLSDFDCDTFFPIKLGEDGKTGEWVRASKEELDAWTGEEVPGGVQEENGTRYVFEMWERRD